MLWTIFIFIITIGYGYLILFYRSSWKKLKPINTAYPSAQGVRVSVIVVGRDEQEHIEKCLDGIFQNDYPAEWMECFFVDDHSTDRTLEIVREQFGSKVKVLELKDRSGTAPGIGFKKAAVQYAIEQSTGELILQTDADCIVPSKWISSHVSGYLESDALFQGAPVLILPEKGWLSAFQQYDFLVTMGITGAGIRAGWHFMANGANMSFARKLDPNLMEGKSAEFASGDDMFLVEQAAARDRSRVKFIKNPETAVFTYGKNNLVDFFLQRFRWAGKTGAYHSLTLKAITALVFAMNGSLLINLGISLIIPNGWILLILQLLIKTLVDLLFIAELVRYYAFPLKLRQLVPALVFYPAYYLITGISVLFPGRWKWKGRSIR